jgi:hypothetical protein
MLAFLVSKIEWSVGSIIGCSEFAEEVDTGSRHCCVISPQWRNQQALQVREFSDPRE